MHPPPRPFFFFFLLSLYLSLSFLSSATVIRIIHIIRALFPFGNCVACGLSSFPACVLRFVPFSRSLASSVSLSFLDPLPTLPLLSAPVSVRLACLGLPVSSRTYVSCVSMAAAESAVPPLQTSSRQVMMNPSSSVSLFSLSRFVHSLALLSLGLISLLLSPFFSNSL